MITCVFQAVGCALCDDYIIDSNRKFRRDIELVAKLADIGDARGADSRGTNFDFATRTKGER